MLTVALTRKLEGEVERSKHNGEKDPPPGQAGYERKRAGSDLESTSQGGIALRELPVSGGKQREGDDEGEENDDEGDVGAERADEVDETQDAHV